MATTAMRPSLEQAGALGAHPVQGSAQGFAGARVEQPLAWWQEWQTEATEAAAQQPSRQQHPPKQLTRTQQKQQAQHRAHQPTNTQELQQRQHLQQQQLQSGAWPPYGFDAGFEGATVGAGYPSSLAPTPTALVDSKQRGARAVDKGDRGVGGDRSSRLREIAAALVEEAAGTRPPVRMGRLYPSVRRRLFRRLRAMSAGEGLDQPPLPQGQLQPLPQPQPLGSQEVADVCDGHPASFAVFAVPEMPTAALPNTWGAPAYVWPSAAVSPEWAVPEPKSIDVALLHSGVVLMRWRL
mmetsp:Transcript_100907/g.290123  ORF Transcript_100907/g.290123 Transcript_100907/m.290123 type:complete len:295 (+) Transcript_100907:92-976(+)